ncbi:hypothetical protein [Nocardia sp. NPDC004711]
MPLTAALLATSTITIVTTAAADTPQWNASIANGCGLVTTAEAAGIFGVSASDSSALDSGTSEHDEIGIQCTYSALNTPTKHMVNLAVNGTGGFTGGKDARTYFTDWVAEDAKYSHGQVPKLGDDDFCILSVGGKASTTMLVVLAGQRVLTFTSYEAPQTCDSLTRFAQAAMPRLNG